MVSDESDEELTGRLRRGDDEAFLELFVRHRSRLKQILNVRMDRRLKGREDASDILQEVYLDARQRLRHFLAKPQLSFFGWLRQLTDQRLIDEHRRHLDAVMRTARKEVPIQRATTSKTFASMARLLVAQLASPSEQVAYVELVNQIANVLEKLDPIDREVLILRHFDELKNHEVAETLGIKQAAASNRYVRALARLRELIEHQPLLIDGLDP